MSAPPIEVRRDELYRTIIVSGIFGGHRPGVFEAIVYTDEMDAEEALGSAQPLKERIKIQRTLQCRLVIDPVQAKSIAKWLNHMCLTTRRPSERFQTWKNDEEYNLNNL